MTVYGGPVTVDGLQVLLELCEMSIFMLLIVPLPFTWRKKMFNFISNSPVIAKFQYGMKVHTILGLHGTP